MIIDMIKIYTVTPVFHTKWNHMLSVETRCQMYFAVEKIDKTMDVF